MLLVEVRFKGAERYWRLVDIVRGDEVRPDAVPDGWLVARVLMTDEQRDEAIRGGYECRVVTDYSKEKDPREDVSTVNRFSADLLAARRKSGGA